MMSFETQRLVIRPYDPESDSDIAGAFAMYSDPEVVRYLSGIPVPDLETQRKNMRERKTFFDSLNNGTGSWAIVEKATNSIIGTTLLKQLPISAPDFVEGTERSRPYKPPTSPADLSPDVEIGWHLERSRWGNGFATEAAWAMVAYGFKHLGLPVLYAVVQSENLASMAVTRRLGMKHLGRTREYYNFELEIFELLRS